LLAFNNKKCKEIESRNRDQHFRDYPLPPLSGKAPDMAYSKIRQKSEEDKFFIGR
jgi:hypothetical protein